jgi:hypothetical protein
MQAPELDKILPEHELKLELFTAFYRVTGLIKTNAYRTNGVLNTSNDHLLLDKVVTECLLRPQDSPISSGYCRIAKNSVVLAVPNDEPETERLLRAAKIYNRGDLLQQRVLISLGNFEVSGNLHLNQELALESVLLDRPELFIGVTDVAVTFLPNLAFKFTAETILINKACVEFICAGTP